MSDENSLNKSVQQQAQYFMINNQNISNKKRIQYIRKVLLISIICMFIFIPLICYFILPSHRQQLREKDQKISNQSIAIQKLTNQVLYLQRQFFVMKESISMLLKSDQQILQKCKQSLTLLQNKQKTELQLIKEQIEVQKQLHMVQIAQEINKLNISSSINSQRISQLMTNELYKQAKDYNYMIKYSKRITWKIFRQNEDYFKDHFIKTSENPLTIMKNSTGYKQIQPETQQRNDFGFHFSVQIQKTVSKFISIGIFTRSPQNTQYYFYSNNKKIYTGQSYMSASAVKQTTNDMPIKQKDIITLFYDIKLKQVVWYVNGRYETHISIPQDYTGYVYPEVFMSSKGDQISIL